MVTETGIFIHLLEFKDCERMIIEVIQTIQLFK